MLGGYRVQGPAELEIGEVVEVAVRNPLENAANSGKPRPAVLVASETRRGDGWLIMGLTTKPTFADGSPRVRIPNPRAIGLEGNGYLWGNTLTWVEARSVESHIGWADRALAFAVADHAQLPQPQLIELLTSAFLHHPRDLEASEAQHRSQSR